MVVSTGAEWDGKSGASDARRWPCRDGRETRDSTSRGRLHLPSRRVSRHTLTGIGASFVLDPTATLTHHAMTASMWQPNHQRCRELAYPDLLNFAVSM
jgi:hypothetical protein